MPTEKTCKNPPLALDRLVQAENLLSKVLLSVDPGQGVPDCLGGEGAEGLQVPEVGF